MLTSGNVKWIALTMVALGVIGTGVGATLQWGDWTLTTGDAEAEEAEEAIDTGRSE